MAKLSCFETDSDASMSVQRFDVISASFSFALAVARSACA